LDSISFFGWEKVGNRFVMTTETRTECKDLETGRGHPRRMWAVAPVGHGHMMTVAGAGLHGESPCEEHLTGQLRRVTLEKSTFICCSQNGLQCSVMSPAQGNKNCFLSMIPRRKGCFRVGEKHAAMDESPFNADSDRRESPFNAVSVGLSSKAGICHRGATSTY
jgi:hypothetical protein